MAATPIAGHGGEGDRRGFRLGRSGCHRVPGSTFRSSLKARLRPRDDGEDCGRGQPGVLGVDIPYPQSDHHRLPGRPGRVPRDLEQARGGKNTTPGSSGAPTPGRWPGPARRGRSGGCGPNRWAVAGSGCSERPRGYFSITLSDTAGQRERAQSRRSRRLAWSAARLRVPRPNGLGLRELAGPENGREHWPTCR